MSNVNRVTLRSVAEKAGVSIMSVSKALNNKGGVSKETAAHIKAIAKEMNYKPNLLAKSLRLDETKTFGVIVSDSSEIVASKVLRGIADASESQGYNIIMANTDYDKNRERLSIEVLASKGIDGLLIVASTLTSAEDTKWLSSLGLPTVHLMRASEDGSIDSVTNDNFQGSYTLTSHLLQKGCKHFHVLTQKSVSGTLRLRGIRSALADEGYLLDNASITYCTPLIDDGHEKTKQLLQSKTKFDALICGCDLIAIGATNAIEEAGLNVPHDICVTGYDGIDLIPYLRTPITTIRQPLYDIGQRGVTTLLERLHAPKSSPQTIILRSELLVEVSTER
ncbi:MAG: LacI family DNA-binding transcriptional regulator [Oscillospiraceae bacterium]